MKCSPCKSQVLKKIGGIMYQGSAGGAEPWLGSRMHAVLSSRTHSSEPSTCPDPESVVGRAPPRTPGSGQRRVDLCAPVTPSRMVPSILEGCPHSQRRSRRGHALVTHVRGQTPDLYAHHGGPGRPCQPDHPRDEHGRTHGVCRSSRFCPHF